MTEIKRSLKDIAPKLVTVLIQNPEMGYSEEWVLKMLTLQEWQDSYLMVEYPAPPKAIQKMVDGKKQDFVDWNDVDYQKRKAQADEKLSMIRLTRALLGAGNFEELADMSLTEAASTLFETGDKAILSALYTALLRLMTGMKGGVEAKKAAFRNDSLHQTDDANHHAPKEGLALVETSE